MLFPHILMILLGVPAHAAPSSELRAVGIALSTMEMFEKKNLGSPQSIESACSIESNDWVSACEEFLNPDTGELGAYGRIIEDELVYRSEVASKNLVAPSEGSSWEDADPFLNPSFVPKGFEDEERICPNYRKLIQDARVRFWVAVFASMASVESTCGTDNTNPNATNGMGVGLLQMELGKDLRKGRVGKYGGSDRLGEECAVSSNEIRLPNANLRCSIQIMADLLTQHKYAGNGKLYKNSGSYWQGLKKTNGGSIGKILKGLPLYPQWCLD